MLQPPPLIEGLLTEYGHLCLGFRFRILTWTYLSSKHLLVNHAIGNTNWESLLHTCFLSPISTPLLVTDPLPKISSPNFHLEKYLQPFRSSQISWSLIRCLNFSLLLTLIDPCSYLFFVTSILYKLRRYVNITCLEISSSK